MLLENKGICLQTLAEVQIRRLSVKSFAVSVKRLFFITVLWQVVSPLNSLYIWMSFQQLLLLLCRLSGHIFLISKRLKRRDVLQPLPTHLRSTPTERAAVTHPSGDTEVSSHGPHQHHLQDDYGGVRGESHEHLVLHQLSHLYRFTTEPQEGETHLNCAAVTSDAQHSH